MTTFKKGETVSLIQVWNRLGDVAITPAVVYSCGKKQMVLTHAVTGEELGRNFQPTEKQYSHGRVVRTDAETVAAEVIAEFRAAEIARFEHQVSLTQFGAGYVNSVQAQLDAINAHNPVTVAR